MLPSHLAGEQCSGVQRDEPIAQFELGRLRNFTYLVLDWETRTAAIVDPQSDLQALLRALEDDHFELTAVLLTHTHFDHIAGVGELRKRWPNIAIHAHPLDQHRLDFETRKIIRPLEDGSAISIGTLKVVPLHTPGHSGGECCFRIDLRGKTYLLTGDTLFIRDCGRTDLEDGSDEQMFASLQRIKSLPPETIILPGHHYTAECASVLSKELIESPPLRCRSVQELTAVP